MDKKGNEQFFHRLNKIILAIKSTYLYKMISKFLSVICTIILIVLLIVGAFMFYFNIKSNAYTKKGIDYTAPFGLYTIISGSMEPNVSVYDVVIAVDEDISKIKVGDVVTFISNWEINFGLTVTHRVIAVNKNENGEYQLITKGDNNGSPDGGVVTQRNLIGRVVGRIPSLGRLQFFLATKMGWFLIVFIPALAIIIFDMIKIFKLYVLKTQIKNVKSTKDVEEENNNKAPIKVSDILEPTKNNPPIKRNSKISEVVLEPIEETRKIKLKEVILEPIIEEDKNIDTVELPKVGEDGKVKENTLEMPAIKTKKEQIENRPTLEDIITQENFKKEEEKLPEIKEKSFHTSIIPIIKKQSELNGENEQRKLLKRRK